MSLGLLELPQLLDEPQQNEVRGRLVIAHRVDSSKPDSALQLRHVARRRHETSLFLNLGSLRATIAVPRLTGMVKRGRALVVVMGPRRRSGAER